MDTSTRIWPMFATLFHGVMLCNHVHVKVTLENKRGAAGRLNLIVGAHTLDFVKRRRLRKNRKASGPPPKHQKIPKRPDRNMGRRHRDLAKKHKLRKLT